MDTTTKLMPNDQDAEKAILGAVLLENQSFYNLQAMLEPEDFYHEWHRWIFQAMRILVSDSKPIDLITLKDQMMASSVFEKIPDALIFLTGLTDGLPRALNIEHYARIVKEKSAARKLISISHQTTTRCLAGNDTVHDILSRLQQEVLDISGRQHRGGWKSSKVLAPSTFSKIEERAKDPKIITGVPSGFYDLDRLTSGFQESDLIIIAARPGEGKTTLGLNIVQNVALDHNRIIGIFSLEMSSEQLMKRLLSSCTHDHEGPVDSHRINTGYLTPVDLERLRNSVGALAEAKIFIDDTSAASITEIYSKAMNLKLEHGLDLIFVDYLQLMTSGQNTENRTQEISQISRGLKKLAKDLRIPVIAASQLNRAIEKGKIRKPQLSDLREGGSIEQDADIIMFIQKTESQDDIVPPVEIQIAKHRNGPTGSFKLVFLKQFTKFASIVEEEEE